MLGVVEQNGTMIVGDGSKSMSTHLCIVDVMDLVENNELDVANQVCAFVKHASEDFRGHDQTAGLWVDLNVPGQDPDSARTEGLLEVPEFLVGERLDR